MMCGGQSQQDATELSRPLVHPKHIMKIGNWNVRTLYRSSNFAQVAREMSGREQTSWVLMKHTGQGKEKCN